MKNSALYKCRFLFFNERVRFLFSFFQTPPPFSPRACARCAGRQRAGREFPFLRPLFLPAPPKRILGSGNSFQIFPSKKVRADSSIGQRAQSRRFNIKCRLPDCNVGVDRALVFGTSDVGSIPTESKKVSDGISYDELIQSPLAMKPPPRAKVQGDNSETHITNKKDPQGSFFM